MTLGGHELAWGPGGGFGAINYGQMIIFVYLICDTGRSRIGVGSLRRSPGGSGVLGDKLQSNEHPGARLRAIGLVGGGGGGQRPGSSGLYALITTDEHNYTFFFTLACH